MLLYLHSQLKGAKMIQTDGRLQAVVLEQVGEEVTVEVSYIGATECIYRQMMTVTDFLAGKWKA